MMTHLAFVLLTYGLAYSSAMWKDCAGTETCFECNEFLVETLLQIAETTHKSITLVTSKMGTLVIGLGYIRKTTDEENMFIAKNQVQLSNDMVARHNLSDLEFVIPYAGELKEKTSKWSVDKPGAIFLQVMAVCDIKCKVLPDKLKVRIYGVGKFNFPSTDTCTPEDYYVYLGHAGSAVGKIVTFTITRPPSRITWPAETLSTDYLQYKQQVHDDQLRYKIRAELLAKFRTTLSPSNLTGGNWSHITFPTFKKEYPESGSTERFEVEADNALHIYTLIGVCGQYTIHTGIVYKRLNTNLGILECRDFAGAIPGTIEFCQFCRDKKCVRGESQVVF